MARLNEDGRGGRLSGKRQAARSHGFTQVIWMTEIQHRMTYDDHRFLVLAEEGSREGTITGFYHYAVTHPLPELRLCGPELFSRPADYKCCLLLLFGFLSAHC